MKTLETKKTIPTPVFEYPLLKCSANENLKVIGLESDC
jgi:hypothetical protein